MFWTEPPFRANLLFGYVQSGPERESPVNLEDPFRTQRPKRSKQKWSVRKLFTLLRHFLKMFEKCSNVHLTYVPI